MDHGAHRVTRAQFEENLEEKLRNARFAADIGSLLSKGYSWHLEAAAELVSTSLIKLLPGDPWEGE